jgi:hypothetical protein
MVKDRSIVFLAFFLVTILIGMYIVHRFDATGVKKFELIITYLGGISVLLITYSIYLGIKSSEVIEKNRIAYNTLENINRNFLQPQENLIKLYPEGFFLYASMNPDTDLSQLVSEITVVDQSKRKQIEIFYSIRVFQSVEDFLSTAAYDITGHYVWLNNFLMWMQSPILQENWKILGFNLSNDTRELVEQIIKKSNDLIALRKEKGKLSWQDYDAISHEFEIKTR